MTTARVIVEAVLRKLSKLGTGESLDANEANDVLESLNDMLAVWSVEGNLIYTETSETFPLVSGTASYEIGSGGDFNTTRPVDVTSVYITLGTTDYILNEYGQTDYAQITNKSITGTPEIYYYNDGYPLATITLYPVPTAGTITINSFKPLTAFTDLNTVFSLKPEYKAALVYNGAIWMASEYEMEPPLQVVRIANRTKKALTVSNARNDLITSNLGVPKSENDRYDQDILRGY